MQRYFGFPPLVDCNSKILILGSFPSVKSRDVGFYYGNGQNRFWKTLCAAFSEPIATTVQEKRNLCLKHGIALWDVVESCQIQGSMDADIKNYVTVDLQTFLQGTQICKILCNGQKAYQLTTAIYNGLPIIKMPSTSPANASFDATIWYKQLQGENYD